MSQDGLKYNMSFDLGFEYKPNIVTEINNTLSIYNPINSQFERIILTKNQELLINNYETYDHNIVKKFRQAGGTTATAAWLSKRILLSPENVMIFSNRKDIANNMLKIIRDFIKQWDINSLNEQENRVNRFTLRNGSRIITASNITDICSYTSSIIVVDEAAYIDNQNIYYSLFQTLETNGKLILISTPNGYDELFEPLYRRDNNFHITNIHWYHDHRYNRDLKWVGVLDILRYIQNINDYPGVLILDYNRLTDDNGYVLDLKPCSPWFESMCRNLNYNKDLIDQEINAEFVFR